MCTQQLEMVGASLLGTVLNRVSKRALGEATYGYGRAYYASRNEVYYTSSQGAADQQETVAPSSDLSGPGVASELESLTTTLGPKPRRGVRD